MSTVLIGMGVIVFGCAWRFVGPAASQIWMKTLGRIGGLDRTVAQEISSIPKFLARWLIAPGIVAMGTLVVVGALG